MKVNDSPKFRLFVVISIVWAVAALLMSIEGASRFRQIDFVKFGSIFLVATSPVWLFWSTLWIWKDKFQDFFLQKEKTKFVAVPFEDLSDDIKKLSKHRKLRWTLYFIPSLILLFFILLASNDVKMSGVILASIIVANFISILGILFVSYKILILTGTSKFRAVIYILFSIIPIVFIVTLLVTEVNAAKTLRANSYKASIAVSLLMPAIIILSVFFNSAVAIPQYAKLRTASINNEKTLFGDPVIKDDIDRPLDEEPLEHRK